MCGGSLQKCPLNGTCPGDIQTLHLCAGRSGMDHCRSAPGKDGKPCRLMFPWAPAVAFSRQIAAISTRHQLLAYLTPGVALLVPHPDEFSACAPAARCVTFPHGTAPQLFLPLPCQVRPPQRQPIPAADHHRAGDLHPLRSLSKSIFRLCWHSWVLWCYLISPKDTAVI